MKKIIFLLLISFKLSAQTKIQVVPIVPVTISYLDTSKAYSFEFIASVLSFLNDTVNGYTEIDYYFVNARQNQTYRGKFNIVGTDNWAWYGNRNPAVLAVQAIDSFNTQLLRKNPSATIIQIKE